MLRSLGLYTQKERENKQQKSLFRVTLVKFGVSTVSSRNRYCPQSVPIMQRESDSGAGRHVFASPGRDDSSLLMTVLLFVFCSFPIYTRRINTKDSRSCFVLHVAPARAFK